MKVLNGGNGPKIERNKLCLINFPRFISDTKRNISPNLYLAINQSGFSDTYLPPLKHSGGIPLVKHTSDRECFRTEKFIPRETNQLVHCFTKGLEHNWQDVTRMKWIESEKQKWFNTNLIAVQLTRAGSGAKISELFYNHSNIGFLLVKLLIVIVQWIIGMGIFVAFIRKHFVQHKTWYLVICHVKIYSTLLGALEP